VRVRGLAPPALLAFVLGAPVPGTEIEIGGGVGAYHYTGGCEGPHNDANFTAMQVRARHLEPSGLVVAVEAAGQRGEVVASAPGANGTSNLGRQELLGVLAARIGYEGRYGGIELGPALLRTGLASNNNDPENTGFISAKVWLGRYGAAHGWVAVLADRALPTNRVAGIGLGHTSERVRASLGLALSAGDEGTYIADADVAVWRGLWLGMGGQFADSPHTWGVLGRVGFFWGRDGGDAARRPVEEPPPAPESPQAPPPPVAAPPVGPAPSVEIPDQAPEVDAGA